MKVETLEQLEMSKLRVLQNLGPSYLMTNSLIIVVPTKWEIIEVSTLGDIAMSFVSRCKKV
mgnify:CR=1 FL=1